MSVCANCNADLLAHETRCSFCYSEVPREQVKWLRDEAKRFMRRNRNRQHIHVGPRSQFVGMARSLSELRVFRLDSYRAANRIATYTWTDYGRALLQELAA